MVAAAGIRGFIYRLLRFADFGERMEERRLCEACWHDAKKNQGDVYRFVWGLKTLKIIQSYLIS